MAEARILAHMNADHRRELAHYLRYYHGFSAADTAHLAHLELVHIDLEGMIITAPSPHTSAKHPLPKKYAPYVAQIPDGQTPYFVPIDPPMASLSEARERLVAMDNEARLALDIVPLTRYVAPHGAFPVAVFLLLVLYLVCWATLPVTVPGSAWYQLWGRVFGVLHDLGTLSEGPGFVSAAEHVRLGAELYAWVVRAIFWPVWTIHFVEAVWFERTRLQPRAVPRWSGLWWAWFVTILIGGAPSYRVADEEIERTRAALREEVAKRRKTD